jgi:hypothetical protein
MGSNPVNGSSAYEDEMNDVALFENALRAAVPTRPDPRLGAALVPRLAEIARTATIEAETRAPRRGTAPRSRLALVARVGIAVALIPLAFAGLAFAGVTVPAPARSAFESVGISLPNQPAKHATAPHAGQGSTHGEGSAGSGTATSETTSDTSKGNSAAAHQHARDQHAKAHGKAKGHEQGKAIGLNDSTPPGQAKDKETGPPSQSNAGGNSENHTTTHTPPGHTTHPSHGNGHANGHSK